MFFGAIHLYDVRMTDPREATGLLQDARVSIALLARGGLAGIVQQLERHFLVEFRVPGPEHFR